MGPRVIVFRERELAGRGTTPTVVGLPERGGSRGAWDHSQHLWSRHEFKHPAAAASP